MKKTDSKKTRPYWNSSVLNVIYRNRKLNPEKKNISIVLNFNFIERPQRHSWRLEILIIIWFKGFKYLNVNHKHSKSSVKLVWIFLCDYIVYLYTHHVNTQSGDLQVLLFFFVYMIVLLFKKIWSAYKSQRASSNTKQKWNTLMYASFLLRYWLNELRSSKLR